MIVVDDPGKTAERRTGTAMALLDVVILGLLATLGFGAWLLVRAL